VSSRLSAAIAFKQQLMHGFLLNIILNYSIVIAALIAAIRFKIISTDFKPFIFLIWLGFFNETLSLILIYDRGYNTINSNIYVLFESIIIFYQFYVWQTVSLRFLYGLIIIVFIIWVADNVIWHPLSGNNSVFRIVYSLLIIACGIKQVNRLLTTERISLIKNPVFLICTAFLMYYSCKAFVEVFNAYHLQVSHAFSRHIFTILYVADFLSNIIYATALLCIPRKQVFTMPY
jgi:hypothetical protein